MIKRILAFAVHQRWLVVLLTLATAGYGIYSLSKLPIDAVPDITNNQVQINAIAPALSPLDIEQQVTFPVETALAGIAGLEFTRSLSRNGFSQVTAVFGERVNIYFARQQIDQRLNEIKASLPIGTELRMGPIATGLGEIYMWALTFTPPQAAKAKNGQPGWQSDGSYLTPEGQRLVTEVERAAYLRTVQDWIVRPQVKNVTGIAGIDVIGGFEKQYHVQPDPARLIAFGISFSDVAEALERNNSSLGAGYFERNGEGFAVRSGGRVERMSEIGEVVITTRNGVPVTVKDVASVKIGGELRTGSASLNGQEAVVATALMLIGANSRTVAAAVDTRIVELRRSLPPDVELKTVLNRTVLVDATVSTVAKNLAEGALLVVVILFLLLGNIRAAIITALVIPFTMLLTFTGMVQSGISANLMSLGALDFGLIVDGAVIVTENTLRRLADRQAELGRTLSTDERLSTVIASSEEMITPSIFGQSIIILVYFPLLTFTGVEGKMFEPMALTVIIALACAFALSLVFVPALIALLISGRLHEKENFAIRFLKSRYRPSLAWSLRFPLRVVAAAMLLFAGSAALFGQLGQEFIPTLDEKNVAMQALRIPSTSLSQSQQMQLEVEKAIIKLPEVAYVFSKTGTAEIASDPMPPNISDTFIILKPQQSWPTPDLPKEKLIQRIQDAVQGVAGSNYEFTQPIQMRFNELLAGVRGDIAVKVFGENFDAMLGAANQIAGFLRSTAGAADVRVEQATGLPVLEIAIDKAAISRFGLSLSSIQAVIGAAIGGRDAGVVFEGDRRFRIVVRLPNNVREDVEALKNLPVSLPRGEGTNGFPTIALRQVATFTFTEGPNQISRENGKRRVVITANVRGRDIGSVVEDVRAKIDQQVKLPPGYWISWGGQFENLAAARNRLMIVVPACFFLIFLLLYMALGSPRDALFVFSAVPLALTGGALALWLRGMPFSVSAAVGFIALSGIAVLNGLVMLVYIKQLLREGVPFDDAVRQGAVTRLRPVIMTALVASLGFVPMAIATGTGAEVQKPLATVVIGGLISATLLTLYVLPALYLRFGRRGISAAVTTLQKTAHAAG